jgi:hypothetical protein
MMGLANSKMAIEQYDSLIKELIENREKGKGEFRFDRNLVIASDIAAQYFCEKKVELQYPLW